MIIYMIQNSINSKVYIGRTNNYKRRIIEHKHQLKHNIHHNPYIQNEYNEYGKNCFIYKILEECDINQAKDREDYWIAYYGGINCDTTYNTLDNSSRSEEFKQNVTKTLSIKNKGKVFTLEYCKKNITYSFS